MTKYIDRYYLNGELYGIKFGGGGWQPGANTLLYMTLNGTAKDEVSGTNGTRTGTETYVTLGSGLKVAHINNSHYMITPTVAMDTEMTVAGWLYRNSGDVYFRADSTGSPRSFYQIQIDSATGNGGGGYRNTGTRYGGLGGTSSNGRYFVVLVCGSGGVKVYSNTQLVYSNSFSNFARRTQPRGLGYDQSGSRPENADGYFSNLIIEKAQRTAQEISDYYNQTKSLYGIS